MNKHSKILIVGHNDVIENGLRNYFEKESYANVDTTTALGLDPSIQTSVYAFFQEHKPEYIFLGSTRSGGIEANQKYGGEFLYHNTESQNNIIYASHKFGVKKLLYIGSSCVYPKECRQPMKEEHLLTGPLEPTSEPYAISKIAGIKLCQAYRKQYGLNAIAMIPATVYGPQSDTNIESAHVIGALVNKFDQAIKSKASEVEIRGSGNPRREFIYVDDFVEACLLLMNHYDDDQWINAGLGEDVSIKELAETIANVSGYKGSLKFDSSRPDGAAVKLLDSSRIKDLGFSPKVSLKEGINQTYNWYSNR